MHLLGCPQPVYCSNADSSVPAQELTSLRIVSVHGFEAPEAETVPAIAAAA